MKLSRRDWNLLLPALAASAASGQQAAQPHPKLSTKLYHHEQVAYSGNAEKKGRRFFYGDNRSGFGLEMHETILGAGTQTHAPHKHAHEEIIIIVEGTVEAYVEGTTETLEAGSVIYFGSNQMHNARNVGKTPSRYYVIELRGDEA